MAVLTPTAKMQFLDASGAPLVGGKLYTYTAGTTTPQPSYTDSSGGTANTNPVILDSRGEANVWLGGSNYKFRLTDANDVEIWTVDNISAPTSGVSPALSGNVTIDTNSSSPALKITQTGTGYALRVQDSADPDATSTVIDNAGRVGIGTVSPSELLDVSGGNIALTSSGGTLYAKITPGATLTDIAADSTRSLTFTTNSLERVRITDTGLVGIGKTPSAGVELDVAGDIAASVSVKTDTITELTSGAGVTVGGVLLKNSLVGGVYRPITTGTAQTVTSGTNVDFTGIPSWAKRVTILMTNMAFAAPGDSFSILLGTGPSTFENTGYTTYGWTLNGSGNSTVTTSISFDMSTQFAISGTILLSNPSGNIWVATGQVGGSGVTNISIMQSAKTTASALASLRFFGRRNGAAFTSGTFNIFYE